MDDVIFSEVMNSWISGKLFLFDNFPRTVKNTSSVCFAIRCWTISTAIHNRDSSFLGEDSNVNLSFSSLFWKSVIPKCYVMANVYRISSTPIVALRVLMYLAQSIYAFWVSCYSVEFEQYWVKNKRNWKDWEALKKMSSRTRHVTTSDSPETSAISQFHINYNNTRNTTCGM